MKRDLQLYLLTGATGYLGKVLAEKLAAAGKTVRALVLPGDPAAGALPDSVEPFYGNVTVPESLDAFFAGDLSRACLIHCAGIISIATRRNPALWRVNVDGTRAIIDKCLQYRPARVIHVSSVHALPEKPPGQVMEEVSFFQPELVKGQYAKSKALGTAYALGAAGQGLDISVVHPSGIIGPYDTAKGQITSAILSFCRGELRLAAAGGYDFVDVRDVADGILRCSELGAPGACYLLSGHYATLAEILGHLSSRGYGSPPQYLPLWLVKLAAPFFEYVTLLRRRPLFLTPYSAYTLGSNALFSHAKASRELGYCPRPLTASLDDTVRWLAEAGMIPPAGAP